MCFTKFFFVIIKEVWVTDISSVGFFLCKGTKKRRKTCDIGFFFNDLKKYNINANSYDKSSRDVGGLEKY